jgi:hypothetical protein
MGERDIRAELDAATRKIQEHPGFKEHQELEALGLSIDAVFAANYRELMDLLNAPATDHKLALELVQNVRPPKVRHEFRAQVTQRLHNYLASVHSLIDHVRRLMHGREGSFVESFRLRKAALREQSEHAFVVDLRNYTLHRRLPWFGHRLSVSQANTPQQKMDSQVLMNVAALLEWDGWTRRARIFLEGAGEVLDLRPVIEKHGQLVFELNSWLYGELASANEAALVEVNELVIARNMILSDGDRAEAERQARWDADDS